MRPRAFKSVLAQRGSRIAPGELIGESMFAKLVEVWLEGLDLESKFVPSAKALYERNIRQIVMPAFNVCKVDVEQARTVPSLTLELAVC